MKGKPGFRFVKADLVDLPDVVSAMKGHDMVWHLGANADIPGGISQTDLDLKNGTIATWNVAEAMRRNGIKPVVYTSSSTIFGDPPRIPTKESDGPLLPISLYGASKLTGEAYFSAYCHLFGLQAWIFRFGNVLGARMNHGAIHDFLLKLKKNPEELEILGDGEQKKNYFLVEECLDGMLHVVTHTNAWCDVFNLGNASTVQVKDLARIVVEETGLKDVKFRFTGGQRGWPGDAPIVVYDVGKVKEIGWTARHSSEQAVRVCTQRLIKEL
jgi:UDP-glucose 4-epimerase